MNVSEDTTEARMPRHGQRQFSGEELVSRIQGKTVWGDYRYGFRYVSFIDRDGTMEGRNDVGAHHFGRWSVNPTDGSFTVSWDGWDNTTTLAYEVDGEIQFYDRDTGEWRTTFRRFKEGRLPLVV